MAKRQSQRKQSKQQGGMGTSDQALKVFGGMGQQRAESDVSNKIATNGGQNPVAVPAAPGAPPAAPTMNGGKIFEGLFGESPKKEEQAPVVGGKQSKQQLQKTIKKQLKQLKQQGGASALSFSEYSAVPQNAVVPDANASAGAATESFARATMRGGQDGVDVPATGDLMKGFMKAGSKLSKDELANFSSQLTKLQQQKQQGGVGMNEIIVPLILLYASQKYSQGKTARNAARPMRRTMRRSRRFRR
jgi:hypothetical protein